MTKPLTLGPFASNKSKLGIIVTHGLARGGITGISFIRKIDIVVSYSLLITQVVGYLVN